ncbi:MAG: ferredoxin [Peptococcaceae bacterium]|jgi:NAD-dependent dihydropyrimidine dehydrogenase PreA subunit|nr:ferredoxin [Peptococcaceae bacterium]
MNTFSIAVSDECIGCGLCVDLCPLDCLRMGKDEKPFMNYSECWYCGACEIECPVSCLKVYFPFLVY